MKIIFSILIATLLPLTAAAEPTIFDVRKNLPMANNEPVFRDFYISSGSEAGLTVGMLLNVQRRMPLYDSYQNRSAGDLQLKVARVKIIHVQKGLAVARLHSEFTREGTPLLEDNFIMVGDQLDLSSATADKKADSGSWSTSEPVATLHSPPATLAKATAQIVVNSVELSSEAASAPAKVDVPHLE